MKTCFYFILIFFVIIIMTISIKTSEINGEAGVKIREKRNYYYNNYYGEYPENVFYPYTRQIYYKRIIYPNYYGNYW
ncbi:hypothetical protein Mgra_00006109 [Meloidogyne graminicola]|uniref:Uncharacterized protein n=1 Tax=Meloidogyne graminicola TaxID=189291 RepID=A0A8S9ZML4_9BILA|nr:hypothetical protein Mgra_00006109 [Meloidogyne graminicola]